MHMVDPCLCTTTKKWDGMGTRTREIALAVDYDWIEDLVARYAYLFPSVV